MYRENDNTKVTLVGHSIGGPLSLYFLTRIVTQEWKDTYIDNYVTLAGAWSGSNAAIHTLLSGPMVNSPLDIKGVRDLRSLYRTFPSFYLLLPRASVWNHTVVVTTPNQNYTTNDYRQLFTDAGYQQGYAQFRDVSMEWSAPNVPTHCFYGLGLPTPMAFVYGTGFPDTLPKVIRGDGNFAVNRQSAEVCLQWADSGYPFNSTVLQGSNHVAILTDKTVLQSIGSIVGAPVDPINDASLLYIVKLHYAVIFLSMLVS